MKIQKNVIFDNNTKLLIYADGSCLGNPGKGGWAALLIFLKNGAKKAEKMISGCSKSSTNNKMELQAVIEALKTIKLNTISYPIEIHVDSQYVQKGLTDWRESWEYRNFRGVKNPEQWKELIDLINKIEHKKIKISINYVKAHNGHPENERVDDEARKKAERC